MSMPADATPSLFRRVVEIVSLCVGLAVVWQLLVIGFNLNQAFAPSSSKVIRALWDFRGLFLKDTVFTFVWVVVGFLVTVVIATGAAIVLHLMPQALSRPVYGMLVILQSVPVFAIAPALYYWTGVGKLLRLVIIVLVAFFPVLVNTADGLRSIDRELLDLFESMNATKWQRLKHLEVPSALQMIVAGLKITVTMCVIGVVVAEMIVGEMIGLGYRPKEASAHFRLDEVMAAVVLLAVIVVALYGLVALITRRLQPWREKI
jgi:ABC-type nitrate/sulfonate/bicarbonate transport system permease component